MFGMFLYRSIRGTIEMKVFASAAQRESAGACTSEFLRNTKKWFVSSGKIDPQGVGESA